VGQPCRPDADQRCWIPVQRSARGVGCRVSGVGCRASGVETVIELAQRNAQNLYEKMAEVTGAARLVCVLPSPDKVTDWVAQAATMPRVVAH
jgi:hypothetical protein